MEKKHRIRIQEKFPYIVNDKPMIVLDIPDEYQFMDEELVLSLKTAVLPYLRKFLYFILHIYRHCIKFKKSTRRKHPASI
jgi:hypothetical protein